MKPSLGERVRERRLSKGWSKKYLSKLSGIPERTILRIERGETPRPHDDTLQLLADAFKIDVAELQEARDSEAPDTPQAASISSDTDGAAPAPTTPSSTNEPAAPVSARNEPIPTWLPPSFRGKRLIYSVAVLIVLLALAILAPFVISWIRMDKVTITGTVLCTDNERVVGVWVEAVNGGSYYAHTFRTNSNGSEAAFKYDLPYSGAYNLHVGCGSSKQDWANTDNTEYGSGTIKDHAAHYFMCQDVPVVAGHGRCYLKQ